MSTTSIVFIYTAKVVFCGNNLLVSHFPPKFRDFRSKRRGMRCRNVSICCVAVMGFYVKYLLGFIFVRMFDVKRVLCLF